MRAMFIKFFIVFVIAFTNASLATANDLLVEITLDDTFTPDIARISSGQIIKWAPKVNGHNVEFVKGPDGANLPPKSVLSTKVKKSLKKNVQRFDFLKKDLIFLII